LILLDILQKIKNIVLAFLEFWSSEQIFIFDQNSKNSKMLKMSILIFL
jgi:hypothetical protein